jgi:two-component system chemotaxis response regulator CheY
VVRELSVQYSVNCSLTACLPHRCAIVVEPDAQQAGFREVEVDPRKRGVGKTVLVVDDSAFVRKAIENAFLSDGFKTCVETENGKKGIEAAKKCQPDLIILDLSMPVMNGLEAAPVLRNLFPKIPIFLFSLYAKAVSKQDAARAGVDWS